jgi:hypothetical protein
LENCQISLETGDGRERRVLLMVDEDEAEAEGREEGWEAELAKTA